MDKLLGQLLMRLDEGSNPSISTCVVKKDSGAESYLKGEIANLPLCYWGCIGFDSVGIGLNRLVCNINGRVIPMHYAQLRAVA